MNQPSIIVANRLLEMKKTLPEMGMAPKVQIFNDYIEKVMPDIKEATEKIEEIEKRLESFE